MTVPRLMSTYPPSCVFSGPYVDRPNACRRVTRPFFPPLLGLYDYSSSKRNGFFTVLRHKIPNPCCQGSARGATPISLCADFTPYRTGPVERFVFEKIFIRGAHDHRFFFAPQVGLDCLSSVLVLPPGVLWKPVSAHSLFPYVSKRHPSPLDLCVIRQSSS